MIGRSWQLICLGASCFISASTWAHQSLGGLELTLEGRNVAEYNRIEVVRSRYEQPLAPPIFPAQGGSEARSPVAITQDCDDACLRERADLVAQQGMENAAWAMFWATGAGVVISALAVLLVWRTLFHTRRAADSALEMASQAASTTAAAIRGAAAAEASVAEAKQATSAANATAEQALQSAELARNAFVLENRPWVSVELSFSGETILQENGRVQLPVVVKIKNIGKTPAEGLYIGVTNKIGISSNSLLDEFIAIYTRKDARFSKIIVLPGEIIVQSWPQTFLYEPPAGQAFKVTVVQLCVGAFYSSPLVSLPCMTVDSYSSAVRVNGGTGLSLAGPPQHPHKDGSRVT